MRVRGDQGGQASVELVALLPVMAGIVLACWQCVVAGESWWLTGAASRAAARAAVIGADPQAAARATLPRHVRRRLSVVHAADGRLVVRVVVPAVVGGAPLWTVIATVAGAEGAT